VDVILCPTTPCAAFELGERMGGDPVKMYREDVLTIPPSLAVSSLYYRLLVGRKSNFLL